MYQPVADSAIRIIGPLGKGGSATVVKAYHFGLKRTVALKHQQDGQDTDPAEFARLIEREYNLIGRYRFPGLVRILEDPGPEYDHLLLEVCPGPTVEAIGRPDDITTVLNLLSAIAVDLEFLRIIGLVHGDLKPQNVFLPSEWQDLRPGQLFYAKLSDFSLARRMDEPHNSRLGLGTIGYMAPETIADGKTGHQSDLFALGIIGYQLLTGIHPFMAEDSEPVKVNSRIREQEPTPLAGLRPDLPAGAAEIVTRLLAKKETGRPASGWDVCQTLEKAGATYPFREILQPSFLIQKGQAYDEGVNSFLRLQENETNRLADLTGKDTHQLRLLLTANFLRGRLAYDDRKFHFRQTIYWPNRLRSHTLRRFGKASFATRRAAVTASIVGGTEAAGQLGLPRAGPASDLGGGLFSLLLPLLRVSTVKRVAARYAPVADGLDRHDLAARLHLMVGDLDQAERCADLAARELNRNNDNFSALALLRRLELCARTTGQEFEVRRSLILKGNIHKENGELDQAQQVYDRIVDLYDNRPPDKLLAETYKNLGELYRQRQDGRAALLALEKSLAVFTELGDDLEISHTLTNIGNVHWIAADTRQALVSYRAAYKIQERLDAKPDLASTLHNIATMFCLDGRVKRGLFLLNHTLKLKKEIGHAGEIARTLNNMGYAYQITGRPGKAADCLTESLEINRRIGSKKEILYNLENLVALKIAAGQLKESLDLLKNGLGFAQKHNLAAHKAPFHLHTATIAKRMGRYGDAVQSLTKVEEILPELDDYSLDLQTAIQKAGLRHHLGDPSVALAIAKDVYDKASASSNSVPELEALLLAVRLTGDQTYWKAAKSIVNERRLVRERRILWFGRVEYLLDHDSLEEAIEQARGLIDQLDEVEQDLELPWMDSLAARILLEQDKLQEAGRHLDRAQRMAQAAGLWPELITILALRGKLAKTEGDFEDSFAALKQALSGCRRLAGSINSDTDRQLFQKKPVMQFLATEISALSRQLGKKQKAEP